MNRTHGHPLVVAPYFHQSVEWSSRLLMSAGVEEEQGRFVPRPPWRAPTAAELAALLADRAPAQRDDPDGCLCLFALPRRVQTTWWDLLDRARLAGATHLEGFAAFVGEVASLLAFKELPVPDGAWARWVARLARPARANSGPERFPHGRPTPRGGGRRAGVASA
jgi:hypothetical protein